MISEVCQNLKNWFIRDESDIKFGVFTVDGCTVSPSIEILPGQYFRIVGSVLNDGVYRFDHALNLRRETFNGSIWLMCVPPDFEKLISEIEAWESKNGASALSPYQNESFGGYSYSKANGSDGNPMTWNRAFAGRLAKWRKI